MLKYTRPPKMLRLPFCSAFTLLFCKQFVSNFLHITHYHLIITKMDEKLVFKVYCSIGYVVFVFVVLFFRWLFSIRDNVPANTNANNAMPCGCIRMAVPVRPPPTVDNRAAAPPSYSEACPENVRSEPSLPDSPPTYEEAMTSSGTVNVTNSGSDSTIVQMEPSSPEHDHEIQAELSSSEHDRAI